MTCMSNRYKRRHSYHSAPPSNPQNDLETGTLNNVHLNRWGVCTMPQKLYVILVYSLLEFDALGAPQFLYFLKHSTAPNSAHCLQSIANTISHLCQRSPNPLHRQLMYPLNKRTSDGEGLMFRGQHRTIRCLGV